MAENKKYRFLLKCKRCTSSILLPHSFCKNCGISTSFFVKENENDNLKSRCSSCNSEIEYVNIPNICFRCGSFERDFWDTVSNNWIHKKIVFPTYRQAIWLVGDFVGDYLGELIAPLAAHSIEDLQHSIRKYDVIITSGQLDNYSFTDKPPKLVFDNSIIPIRQPSIKSVLVKELDSQKYVPLDLVDIVIYDWTKIADKEFISENKIVGRISGKICGCLVREVAVKPVSQEPVSQEPVSQEPVSQEPVSQEPVSQEPVSQKPVSQKPVSQKPVSQKPVTQKPVTQKPLTEEPASSRQQNDSSLKDCIICRNWFQLLITVLIFFIFQNENNSISSGDQLICHLKQATLFYVMVKLVCYLRKKLLPFRDRYLPLKIKEYIGIFLFLLSIFSLLILLSNSYQIHCFGNAIQEYWPWIIFVCFLLSALLDNCFLRLSLAIIFAYTILFVFICANPTCYPIDKANQTSVKNQLKNVGTRFKGAIDDKKAELLEEKLKEISLPDTPAEKKITLKELETAPNPLSRCDSSLYLGELSLFDRGSSIIKNSANDKLFKVADLLKEQPSDAQYIITGHADKTGEITKDGIVNPKGFANNMRLSKERAKSLANWLVSHKVLSKEQIDIRGVGSTEPLVDDSDLELQKVNIRVEIQRNCRFD